MRLGDLAPALPAYAIDAIREALPLFGKQIRGFDRDDAVLTGVESRTSSPVRITRDAESLQSLNVRGLYPCGEGAGYAGGILSAGVDGIKVAEAVARRSRMKFEDIKKLHQKKFREEFGTSSSKASIWCRSCRRRRRTTRACARARSTSRGNMRTGRARCRCT